MTTPDGFGSPNDKFNPGGRPLTPKPEEQQDDQSFGYEPVQRADFPGATVPPTVVYPATAFEPGSIPPGADPADPFGQGAAASGPYAAFTPEPTAEPVPFGLAVDSSFRRMSDFEGRSTRAEYWWFALFAMLTASAPLCLLIFGNDGLAVAAFVLVGLLSLVNGIVTVAASVRRLHDGGYTGWLAMFWLAFGFIVMIFCTLPTKTVGNSFQPPSPVAFRQPRTNPRWPYAVASMGAVLTLIGMIGIARWPADAAEIVPSDRASEVVGACWDTAAPGGPVDVPCTDPNAVGRVVGFVPADASCDPNFPQKSYTRPGEWVCLESLNVPGYDPNDGTVPSGDQGTTDQGATDQGAGVTPAGRASENIGTCWDTSASGGPAVVACDSPDALGRIVGFSSTEAGCNPNFPEKSYSRPGEWVCLESLNVPAYSPAN